MKIDTFIEIHWKNDKKINRIYKTFSSFSNEDFIHWMETDLELQRISSDQEVFIDIIFDLEHKGYYTDIRPEDWHCKPLRCYKINIIKTLGPMIEAMEKALSNLIYIR